MIPLNVNESEFEYFDDKNFLPVFLNEFAAPN
jgi:hypothetical protein